MPFTSLEALSHLEFWGRGCVDWRESKFQLQRPFQVKFPWKFQLPSSNGTLHTMPLQFGCVNILCPVLTGTFWVRFFPKARCSGRMGSRLTVWHQVWTCSGEWWVLSGINLSPAYLCWSRLLIGTFLCQYPQSKAEYRTNVCVIHWLLRVEFHHLLLPSFLDLWLLTVRTRLRGAKRQHLLSMDLGKKNKQKWRCMVPA